MCKEHTRLGGGAGKEVVVPATKKTAQHELGGGSADIIVQGLVDQASVRSKAMSVMSKAMSVVSGGRLGGGKEVVVERTPDPVATQPVSLKQLPEAAVVDVERMRGGVATRAEQASAVKTEVRPSAVDSSPEGVKKCVHAILEQAKGEECKTAGEKHKAARKDWQNALLVQLCELTGLHYREAEIHREKAIVVNAVTAKLRELFGKEASRIAPKFLR